MPGPLKVPPPGEPVKVAGGLLTSYVEARPLNETVGNGFTVIVTWFEFATFVVTHVEFDVIVHVTTCPFVKEEVTKVALFVPAFPPSTFH